MIPFTHSLFFKALAKPWLGVGLSLHHSQRELSGPHRGSNRNPVAAASLSMVELKGGFLLFKIPLSPWMPPPPGFAKEKKNICLSLVLPTEEELLKTLNMFCCAFGKTRDSFLSIKFFLFFFLQCFIFFFLPSFNRKIPCGDETSTVFQPRHAASEILF